MSARPHRLHLLAILLAAALPATNSWSTSIGALQVHSFLGQPLLATVTLNLSEDENLTVLDCIRTLRADDDLSGPGLLRQELFVSSRRATLHLQGIPPLNEPLIGMRISVGCNEPAQLQRDYTLMLDPPPVPEVLPASATETPLPSSASSDVKPISTPATSARPIRPAPIRAKRTVSASKAEVASRTTIPVVAAPPSSASPASTPNADDARPILKIETASATEIRAQDLENELQVLQNQHAQLRVEMTQLEQRMALLQIQLENKVLATAPVASAPPPQVTPQSDIPPRRIWPWLMGGGLTALLLAAAAWLLARRNNESGSETDWLKRPMTPTELDVDTLTPAKTVAVSAGIEVADDDSELDQAEFLLSEGQALEAIDLLYNVIEKEPSEVRAWLMLLRTLCQRDNPQEFAAVAERFKATAPDAGDWDIVLAMGRDLEPDNPLYAPMRETLVQNQRSAGQTTLDFFIETKPAEAATLAPKLDIGLESLPEEPIPGDSSINQISRRDAA